MSSNIKYIVKLTKSTIYPEKMSKNRHRSSLMTDVWALFFVLLFCWMTQVIFHAILYGRYMGTRDTELRACRCTIGVHT